MKNNKNTNLNYNEGSAGDNNIKAGTSPALKSISGFMGLINDVSVGYFEAFRDEKEYEQRCQELLSTIKRCEEMIDDFKERKPKEEPKDLQRTLQTLKESHMCILKRDPNDSNIFKLIDCGIVKEEDN